MIAILLVLAAQAADPKLARSGEITERLNEPAKFTFVTPKRPEELELCVADAISTAGTPAAFRMGPNRSVVIGTQFDRLWIAIDLSGGPRSTTIVGHVRGKAFDDRMRERVRLCV